MSNTMFHMWALYCRMASRSVPSARRWLSPDAHSPKLYCGAMVPGKLQVGEASALLRAHAAVLTVLAAAADFFLPPAPPVWATWPGFLPCCCALIALTRLTPQALHRVLGP